MQSEKNRRVSTGAYKIRASDTSDNDEMIRRGLVGVYYDSINSKAHVNS
jgi:hypothetical protein